MSEPNYDLGDGLTAVKAGPAVFHIDLVGWMDWYTAEYARVAGDQAALVTAAQAKAKADCNGVELNRSQADALLFLVVSEYTQLKNAQRESLTSQNSSGSTASL